MNLHNGKTFCFMSGPDEEAIRKAHAAIDSVIWWPKRRPLGEKGCEKRIRLTVFKPLRRCLSIRGQFQRLLARRGAAATTVEIERVTHIPADPKTGKHRQVVREG